MDPQQLQQAIQALQSLIASLKKEQPPNLPGSDVFTPLGATEILENLNKAQEKQIENNNSLQEQLDEILKTEKTRSQQIKDQELLIEQLQQRKKDASDEELEQLDAAIKKRKENIKALQAEAKEEENWFKRSQKRIEQLKKENKEVIGLGKAVANMGKVAAQQQARFTGFDFGMLSLENVRNQVMALDDLGQQLRRTTGMNANFFKSLGDTQNQLKKLGITSAQSAQSISALAANFSDFTRMTDINQIKDIANFTTKMTLLGVSAESTAQNFEFTTKVLGENVAGAKAIQEELVQAAVAIKMQPGLMAQSFAQNAPKLALYGEDIIKVLKNMQIQSKATGIGMDSLLNVSEGFMTFEGAARKTAQLNAMFGTMLTGPEMMMAAAEGPDVLVAKLQGALQGFNFEGPQGVFALKSLSEIVGFSPKDLKALIQGKKTVEEIQNAVQGTSKVPMDELYKRNVKLNEQQQALVESIQNLAGKELRGTMKVMQDSFLSAGGLVDKVSGTATFIGKTFSEGTKMAAGGLQMLGGLVAQTGLFVSSMASAFGPLTVALYANTAALVANFAALSSKGGFLGKLGTGAKNMGGSLLARGKGLLKGGSKLLGGAGMVGGVGLTGLGAYNLMTKKGVKQGQGASDIIGGGMLTAGSAMMTNPVTALAGAPLVAGSAAIGGLQAIGADTGIADAIYSLTGGSGGSDLKNVGKLHKARAPIQRAAAPQVNQMNSDSAIASQTSLAREISSLNQTLRGNREATEANTSAVSKKSTMPSLSSAGYG
jgi:hypothetical protein